MKARKIPHLLHRALCFFGFHDWRSMVTNGLGQVVAWDCPICKKKDYSGMGRGNK